MCLPGVRRDLVSIAMAFTNKMPGSSVVVAKWRSSTSLPSFAIYGMNRGFTIVVGLGSPSVQVQHLAIN